MDKTIQLDTELGIVVVAAEVVSSVETEFNLTSISFEPQLPTGMRVKKATAIVLQVYPGDAASKIRYTCTLEKEGLQGHGCSGQYLDAWEWGSKSNLLVIGTEDGEALGLRLKKPEYSIDNTPVFYEHNKISIRIEDWVSPNPLSLHFIVAENPLPEPEDCSCWFAADQPHDRLLSNLG